MFVPLALAVIITPPGPLSPEDLPPPPPAKPVEPPQEADATECALQFKSGFVPCPPAELAARAVAAIAAVPRAVFAETDGGRTAWGYTDTCQVVVVCVPEPDGATAYVFVASFLDEATEPVVPAVFRRLTEPAGTRPAARFGTRNADREGRLPPLRCYAETRPATTLGKHFAGQAALALERRGYSLARAGNDGPAAGVYGRRPDRQKVLVLMVEGSKGRTTHFVAAGLGPNADTAATDAKAVCQAVVRAFYD